ncbi:hypothetical protein KAI32_01810 [Candidatus Pacearchaeota archaeon]|nr:hypothetical protein [Candidatus Pacearchaeota archaeon]
MPPNARWGRVKIIKPENPSRAQELVGGLRNAFERGESFTKAKQSFINAGYNPSDVDIAAQELRKLISSSNRPTIKSNAIPASGKPMVKQLPKTPLKIIIPRKNGIPKFLIVILIIILIAILVGATVLGLFWDQWF